LPDPHWSMDVVDRYREHCLSTPGEYARAARHSIQKGKVYQMRAELYEGAPAYEDTFKPFRYRTFATLPLGASDKPIGALGLARSRMYDADEMRRLDAARVYLGLAMSVGKASSMPGANNAVESGMVVIDAEGRIRHRDPKAEHLLRLASDLPLVQQHSISPLWQRWMRSLAEDVMAALRGAHGLPPQREFASRWGCFRLRAWLLEEGNGAAPLIGVLVTREAPPLTRVLELAALHALTPRETATCIALWQHGEYGAVARQLGVSKNTVKTLTRGLYGKLGVTSREDLCAKILPPG
jgi:DNA-binding CsgD family transcriptional regulator